MLVRLATVVVYNIKDDADQGGCYPLRLRAEAANTRHQPLEFVDSLYNIFACMHFTILTKCMDLPFLLRTKVSITSYGKRISSNRL